LLATPHHYAPIRYYLAVYSAALDAHRRGNNSLSAVALLQEMRARHLQPTAGHNNLVLRTLRAEVGVSVATPGLNLWHVMV
jgi:pentatricopeptide repeat protein